MTTNRRTFLAIGAAGLAATTVVGCTKDEPEEQPSPSPSDPSSAGGSAGNPSGPAVKGSLKEAILADKPLLYLDFQDDSGAKAPADQSGHQRKTVMHGDKWWVNDALSTPAPNGVGRAFYSGLSNDTAWVEIPDAKDWLAEVPTTGVTVEMWLFQEEPNFNQALLAIPSDQDQVGWALGLERDGTGLAAEGPEYKGAHFKTARTTNQWHHYALTVTDKGGVNGYLDGKQVGTGNIGPYKGKVTGAAVGTRDVKKGTGASLSGQWSQYAIFGSPLPADRIKAHYDAAVAANAQPVVRGVDAYFGGPENYYKQFTNAEVLADATRFPVAEWWINGTVEELKQEKNYTHGGVVVDPKVTPEALQQSGMWAIRTTGMDMNGKAGAETVGWLPEDEADMDSVKMKKLEENLDKHPKGYLAYSNFGTGVTISSIDRYRVKPLIDRPDLHQVSADLYSYCVHPTMRSQVAKAWNLPEDVIRRAAAHGMVVERCRAFLSRPMPVWGVVAIGHANVVRKGEPGYGSVPTADEVEGALMSCITAGASGILIFPQTFADDKPAPIWKASETYKVGDTVRDSKEEYRFWYCRSEPKKGVDPREVTDDSWLSWRPGAFGVRNDGHYARGVSDRVKKVTARLQTLAPVLYSQSEPRTFHADLHTRYWPKAPDGHSYLIAMQRIQHEKGTYEFRLPEGVTPDQLEVMEENRTVAVKDGVFSDTFENEWEHHLYRWKS
ncbi:MULTISPECIES: LamG-like jellyroll fold domain-containing protein [unclassified Luteococcus]|uniref:LamG-like jellyroll fold domain-containing protein n=1 Tax=unclassified Luteococcus TaxID=2639923 RepID=UPI00313B5A5E